MPDISLNHYPFIRQTHNILTGFATAKTTKIIQPMTSSVVNATVHFTKCCQIIVISNASFDPYICFTPLQPHTQLAYISWHISVLSWQNFTNA